MPAASPSASARRPPRRSRTTILRPPRRPRLAPSSTRTATRLTFSGATLPAGCPGEASESAGRPFDNLAVTIRAPAVGDLPVQTLLRPGDASVDLVSWNLPGSNPVRLLIAEDAPVSEAEPNDTPEKAQPLKTPALLIGRFNPRGDRDWYTFEATKGEKLWIEVVSQRLGLPVDPQIVLQQAGEVTKEL